MKEIEELRTKIKEVETIVSFTTLIVDLNNIVSRLEANIEELQKRDNLLCCLENAGVDNWEGFEYALRDFNEDEDEE